MGKVPKLDGTKVLDSIGSTPYDIRPPGAMKQRNG
jgi:hypothetical protein